MTKLRTLGQLRHRSVARPVLAGAPIVMFINIYAGELPHKENMQFP